MDSDTGWCQGVQQPYDSRSQSEKKQYDSQIAKLREYVDDEQLAKRASATVGATRSAVSNCASNGEPVDYVRPLDQACQALRDRIAQVRAELDAN